MRAVSTRAFDRPSPSEPFVKISQLAIRVAPAVCAAALLTTGVRAAEPPASSAVSAQLHHRVTPPPRPTVVTEVMPGIPEHERETTEQGKGRARGFDARRHRT